MEFLSLDECVIWCKNHGYGEFNRLDGYVPQLGAEFHFRDLLYSPDSGRKIALAHDVVEWATAGGEILIWISEWTVWPSSEHMPLYDRLRQALGDSRPLIATPGHLADSNSADDGVSIAALAQLFFWDFYVFRADGGPVFFASHDETNGFFIRGDKEFPPEFEKWRATGADQVEH